MDDPHAIALKILTVLAAVVFSGLGVYLWGVVVVGAPYRLFRRLAAASRWATEAVVHAPDAGWRLWKGIALVGIAVSTTLGFWVHATYYRVYIDRGRAHAASEGGTATTPQPDRLSEFVPEVAWTSPTDRSVTLLCVLFFVPIAAMHIPIFRNRFRLSTEDEMKGHFGFAAMALGVALCVHAALFYSPLGGLVYQGLNRLTNAGMYMGVLAAVVVVEYIVMALWKRG